MADRAQARVLIDEALEAEDPDHGERPQKPFIVQRVERKDGKLVYAQPPVQKIPVIAATTVYQWLFAQRFGVVNWVLDKLGWHSMADYNWMGSQLSTFSVIVLLIVWQSIPFVAINLYAATTTIPKELYEAASLDGAGAWQSFTSVTLPFLRPFLYSTTFLEVIWVFKAFPQVFAMNEGGPDRLTETLPIYAYVEGVGNQHFGVGAAISFLTILVLLVITSYYLRMVLKQEEDEL